ncbi:hypothetical protein NEUTE1DRAFT_103879 [Neurospora tetrasperma FGSC 2508]|uniref:Extracellular membrane protein CFEM domain-containing protein n=1 Tax=Neurospora tetrasperma (strain FGSC 2508 / ATCC MYA-4615 / P0657) TaxID=510951 RepID=F8MXG1_NEUT8|nr:uncharacterized protein NEUTE1DRAFT_103879 [Neurospora tetrasperma FGSC 2508]EGO54432.1 hypothetical protein NEUTE1DRAFT_103879 [Neurospora tetrasperma FGSC 2508]EGZ68123.1 hypothetical protein NEUTE2DRAFT_74204 [Neurospora tetrasperma FGSC 2509]
MRGQHRSSPLPLLGLLGVAKAAQVVYITDLAIYNSLAPCAQTAISYNVQGQTRDACPAAVGELQGCVCTKNNNFAAIKSDVSKSVNYYCGSTATEDQASAGTVLSAYCSQDKLPEFPQPSVPVTQYITDVPEVAALAPCAFSALGYAIREMGRERCPSDLAAYATCACQKNQNSLLASQLINSSVKYYCEGHTADVSSAQGMWSAWCKLNEGTSAFPKPSNPPGDMTYYIKDLPQYSSLANCAASAVSYAVQGQARELCPDGPQALASCVCLKDQMLGLVTSSITASVKYSCGVTATDDISSAMAVLDLYCNAANNKLVANGVTASESQADPTPTAQSGSRANRGAQATASSGSGSRSGSGSGSNSGDDSTGGANDGGSGSGNTGKKSSNTGVIAGAVIGVLVGLGIIAALLFFFIRRSKQRKNMEQTNSSNAIHDVFAGEGKPELAGNPIVGGAATAAAAAAAAAATVPPSPPSRSASMLKDGTRVNSVSPVSAGAGRFPPPQLTAELQGQGPPHPLNSTELHGQTPAYPPMPNTAELHAPYGVPQNPSQPLGQGPLSVSPMLSNASELQGSGGMYPGPNRQELQGQGTPPQFMSNKHEMMGPQRPAEPQPTAWQSGPVLGYHEMDGHGRGSGGQP